MTTITENQPWDFSRVLAFSNAFTPTTGAAAGVTASTPPAVGGNVLTAPRTTTNCVRGPDTSNEEHSYDSAALGNFSKVWQFLGIPNPPSTNKPDHEATTYLRTIKDDYASDGAAYKSKGSGALAGVQCSDSTDGEGSGLSATSAHLPTTKTQRKRAKRKEKKAALALLPPTVGIVSESEAEHVAKQTPARKASAHIRSATPTRSQRPAESAMNGSAVHTQQQRTAGFTSQSGSYLKMKTQENNKTAPPLQNSSVLYNEQTQKAIEAVAKATAALEPQQKTCTIPPRSPRARNQKATTVQASSHVPTATPASPQMPSFPLGQSPAPKLSGSISLVPASVQPTSSGYPTTPKKLSKNVIGLPSTAAAPRTFGPLTPGSFPKSANGAIPHSVMPTSAPPRRVKPPTIIEPHIIRSGEDRHWALFMKIIGNFYEDRKFLVSPMTLTTHNNDPNGIHLFVDASNIFIGFMNQLKLSRGIHPMSQLPQANLSFDGLALLMERRRPVARRILVGSTPHLPAFDKATAVGYECNILEKVFKARELTERQIYFRESDARRFGRPLKMTPGPAAVTANGSSASTAGNGVGSGSGSETNTPQFDPPKYIEQGVDEILHLKMMQSVVDAERPSTMVLATGDAAAAEYSDGFMANVQRALKKGWKVELISWSKSISSMYTKRPWMEQWGGQFRIIYLDDYAEELLDMDLDS